MLTWSRATQAASCAALLMLSTSVPDSAVADPRITRDAVAAGAVVAAASAVPETARVHIGPQKGGTDMFVAWPTGEDVGPAVIVIHEWWGLNGQIRDVARRFAKQGYLAVVPDLYHGKVAGDAEGAHTLARGLEEDEALEDLDAAIAWLRGEPRARKQPIGAVGFCMGGRLTQLLAVHSDELAGAVVFYGRPITDEASIAKLDVPLQGHYGDKDGGIPVERVKKFEKALDDGEKTSEIYIYPGAGHAFMHEPRDSYHPHAARQAWARTLAFFQKHLKGSE